MTRTAGKDGWDGHGGHRIQAHDHSAKAGLLPIGKLCPGRYWCQDCRCWLTGVKCAGTSGGGETAC
jgi:hypothetical protein